MHIFYTCNVTNLLWNELKHFRAQNLDIPEVTPQSTFFEFFDMDNQKQNLH